MQPVFILTYLVWNIGKKKPENRNTPCKLTDTRRKLFLLKYSITPQHLKSNNTGNIIFYIFIYKHSYTCKQQ